MIKSYIEEKEIQELWQDYKENRDVELRDKLIDNYSPLLKNIVKKVYYSLPNHVEISDLENYAIIGLMDAINKFDIGRDIKFETYANFRIKGAIIDGIRKTDWLPRSLRRKEKNSEQSNKEFTLSSLDDPDLNLDKSLYDNSGQTGYKRFNAFVNDFVEEANKRVLLLDAIKNLSDEEKKLIILYYFKNRTFKEISRTFDLTESRICQIHKKVLDKLRNIISIDYN